MIRISHWIVRKKKNNSDLSKLIFKKDIWNDGHVIHNTESLMGEVYCVSEN